MRVEALPIEGDAVDVALAQLTSETGASGVPIALDAREKPSHVEWYSIGLPSGRMVLGKIVDLGNLSLVFCSPTSEAIAHLQALLDKLGRDCVNVRLFLQSPLISSSSQLALPNSFAVQKQVLLKVLSLSQRPMTSVDRTFRSLESDDVEEVARLYASDSRNVFTTTHFAQGGYYGVFDGNTLVSACCVYGYAPANQSYLIGGFITDPKQRRHGFASALCEQLSRVLLERSRSVTLHVEETNYPAARMYSALGFQHAGTILEIDVTRQPQENK